MEMVNKKNKLNYAFWIFMSICLILQIVFLMYTNLVHMKSMVDYDSSSVLVHAMEIWKQKTLFISEYGYQTTIDIDSMVWLTALLYGITKDIFLSQAISNCFIILVYVYVLERLFRRINLSNEIRIASIICFFIPYTLGQLGYLPMLFSGPSFYTIKALFPLLLISILLDMKEGVHWKYFIVRLIAVFIISYFTGLSSGVYVLLCALLPIIVAEIVSAILDDNIKSMFSVRNFVSVVALCIGMVGVASEKSFGLTTRASNMVLVSRTNWLQNIGSYFVGMFELFGGVAVYDNTELLSKEGIFILINWLLVSLMLISLIYTIVKSIMNRKIELVDLYCIAIFTVNLFVLTLLYTTYGGGSFEARYHIIPMIPLFILLGKMVNDIASIRNRTFSYTFRGIYFLVVLLSLVTCDKNMNDVWKSSNVNVYEEMKSSLEVEEFKNVVFLGNTNAVQGRIMRVFLADMNCIIADDDWRNVSSTTWGGTSKALDAKVLRGKTAVVATPELWESLPIYLKNGSTLYKEYEGYNIYSIEKNKFDFIAGFPATKKVSMDYPYTLGYGIANADFDENGNLVSNGQPGIILYGPYVNGVEGKWNLTLRYKIVQKSNPNDVATFSVIKNGGQDVLGSIELDSQNRVATIENVEISDEYVGIENWVCVPEGMIIQVSSIQIEKVK